jgi:hypothetical protein
MNSIDIHKHLQKISGTVWRTSLCYVTSYRLKIGSMDNLLAVNDCRCCLNTDSHKFSCICIVSVNFDFHAVTFYMCVFRPI